VLHETKYAKSGDMHIAYQVVGSGPIDLVFIPGWLTHVELQWEEPTQARFFRRLASFARLILIDNGASVSRTVCPRTSCRSSKSGSTTFARCSTPSARNEPHSSASPRAER
jgi:hypothetical protein